MEHDRCPGIISDLQVQASNVVVLKRRAFELTTLVQQEVANDVLVVHASVSFGSFESVTSVGISFVEGDASVSNVMVGGPAFNSRRVHKGDVIVGVDGKTTIGSDLKSLLIGVDTPGSVVELTLRKASVSELYPFAFFLPTRFYLHLGSG